MSRGNGTALVPLSQAGGQCETEWARTWRGRDAWSHVIGVLCGHNPRDVRWTKENLRHSEIAELWKDHLAASPYAMDDT